MPKGKRRPPPIDKWGSNSGLNRDPSINAVPCPQCGAERREGMAGYGVFRYPDRPSPERPAPPEVKTAAPPSMARDAEQGGAVFRMWERCAVARAPVWKLGVMVDRYFCTGREPNLNALPGNASSAIPLSLPRTDPNPRSGTFVQCGPLTLNIPPGYAVTLSGRTLILRSPDGKAAWRFVHVPPEQGDLSQFAFSTGSDQGPSSSPEFSTSADPVSPHVRSEITDLARDRAIANTYDEKPPTPPKDGL